MPATPKKHTAAAASRRAAPVREESATMTAHRIFTMAFAKVYPLYIQKAERKNRTKDEVDQIIRWLTGYDRAGLQRQLDQQTDFATFFAQSPRLHPNSALIT